MGVVGINFQPAVSLAEASDFVSALTAGVDVKAIELYACNWGFGTAYESSMIGQVAVRS